MDASYASALAALAGAAIGGMASFGSSWLTQRNQLRFTHLEANRAKRMTLYAEFVDEASRLYGDALGHQKDEPQELVKIYALLGRIRLIAPHPVAEAAEKTFDAIIEAYVGPNRTLRSVMEDLHQKRRRSFIADFTDACREHDVVSD
jgi:hypothetical protein